MRDQRCLGLGRSGNHRRPGAVQDLGMTAIGPGRRAGRIDQHRVEPAPSEIASANSAGVEVDRLADQRLRLKSGPLEIGRKSRETTFRPVERGDVIACRRHLHGLAPRCRAQVEHLRRTPGHQPRGKARGKVLDPPSARLEPRQVDHRRAAVKPDVALGELDPPGFLGERLGLLVAGETQVERRTADHRAPRRRHDVASPCRVPALLDRSRKRGFVRRTDPTPKQGPEHAMDQAPRPTLDQRECGRDQRMVGNVQGQPLGERKPEHRPRLGVVRQWQPRRAVDQCVEFGQPPQGLPRDRERKRPILVGDPLRGPVERLSAPKNGVEQPERGSARTQSFDRAWSRVHQRPSSFS